MYTGRAMSDLAVTVHSNVPVRCLGPSTRQLLAMRLDPTRTVLSPTTRRLQDWRGLAEVLAGFHQTDVDYFQRRDCPTVEVLRVWSRDYEQASVGDVLNALREIERYDILQCPEFQRAVGKRWFYLTVG